MQERWTNPISTRTNCGKVFILQYCAQFLHDDLQSHLNSRRGQWRLNYHGNCGECQKVLGVVPKPIARFATPKNTITRNAVRRCMKSGPIGEGPQHTALVPLPL